jgi:hypothetical membrane protein
MKKNRGIIVLETVCITALLVMFVLPFFSAPEYSIIRNTLSELGAQSAPRAWIMNYYFVSLAIGSIFAGWRSFEGFTFHRIVLVIFGLSLTLMALFNHAPVNPHIYFSTTEDGWHAYFVCTAGLSFILLSLASSLILDKQQDRLLAIGAGLSVILLSILMSEAEWAAGVWQRLMFMISFGWMIYNFRTREL